MIDLKWGNPEKTMMVFSFIGPWTWEEYDENIKRSHDMYDSVTHKVHMVMDFSQGRNLPSGAFEHLRNAASGDNRAHRGLIILVGAGSLVQAIASILLRLYPKAAQKFQQVKTLEEAYALVEQANLSWA